MLLRLLIFIVNDELQIFIWDREPHLKLFK